MTSAPTAAPDLGGVPAAVDSVLRAFLDGKARVDSGARLGEFVDVLRMFLAGGGKRLRPLLCACGWQAAGGGDPGPALPAAASLELFHTFALIHDDVMDHSDTRRGRPTVHRLLAARARSAPRPVDPDDFGVGGAILLGDLTMVWSDELFCSSDLPVARLRAARPVLQAMRSEVVYGQYLDLLGAADHDGGVEAALTVARYKTARYTVERPLQLGMALAGGGRALLGACSAYGLPLGEAFQLRDDVLGVFGDPATTGKSCLDDLREGKHTALLALALERAGRSQERALRSLVGDPQLDEAGAARVREIFLSTGALAVVEQMIAERRRHALSALDRSSFPPEARAVLQEIAARLAVRSS